MFLFYLRTFCFLFGCFLLIGTVSAAPSVVVIDPGHGGHDRGGMPGQRWPEKGFTLDIGLRLARILRRQDVKVVLTRSDDTFIPLNTRTNISNRYYRKKAVFVSIHLNGAPREGAYGIETYYNRGSAYRLAALIHPRVIHALGSMDRKIKSRSFWVLRKNRLPAVLVECGFLTNHQESRKIRSAENRQAIANAIARGVLSY
jgi:N-acetylmuramoyl-L-alanine amidase